MTTFNKVHALKRAVIFKQDGAALLKSATGINNDIEFAGSPNAQELIVKGQGTFIFKPEASDIKSIVTSPLELSFRTEKDEEIFSFRVDREGAALLIKNEPVAQSKKGLVDVYAYYWISIDTCNNRIRYGVGEARLETMALEYQLDQQQVALFQSITIILLNDATAKMRLLRDPIVEKVPLKVKSTEQTTMNHIAENTCIPKAALSPVGQQLYDTISGAAFILNTDDFPEFSQAVKYSIETPGCWCHKKLIEKQGEFGEPQEVYLRITLGSNGGESPGIPFVMEIWPPQCYSPVHQHAGANAIIRVLHGQIQVALFPYLKPKHLLKGAAADEFSFATGIFEQNDITWISPVLNQIHRLKNADPMGGQPCITIQCYMYDESDTGHYPYFDYTGDDGSINQFVPDSDMDFVAFKALMKQEWMAR